MLDQTPIQLEKEGIKEREDGEMGGFGRLLEGGEYFHYFPLRGEGGGVVRGRRLIEGQLLFEEIWYMY